MEILYFGIMIGALLTLMILILGVLYDRIFQGKSDRRNSDTVHSDDDNNVGDPDNGGNNRKDADRRNIRQVPTPDEVILVLESMMSVASPYEKQCLQQGKNIIERLNNMIEKGAGDD